MNARDKWQSLTWDEVQVDPEFARLAPPLARDERCWLKTKLLKEGCLDPLRVWAWEAKNLILDGHNRHDLCGQLNIPFFSVFIDLPSREAARAYIVSLQLGRRNLSSEAASYLRGKRYQAEKKPRGRDWSSAGEMDQNDPISTAQRLAEEYKVGEATIKRDERFARAVDALVEQAGEDARDLILARDSGLSRGQVERLAKKGPEEQQAYLRTLQETGKPPRRTGLPHASITLPTEPKVLVPKLLVRLGRQNAAEVSRLLSEALR